jgi:argininosuccinate lyase
LVTLAENNLGAIMPGYTHLQHAQPILLAHHMLAYFWMFQRDMERFADCHKRVDVLPLGSGALAGTSYPLDRHFVAQELGFSALSENSLDAVSDRDFAVEFLSACSITMMHLSRFSEDIILWMSQEFKFIELDDAYTTGSSIMPQKKNPDVAELTRGKTARVYGDLNSLLVLLKGLPLSYNRDLQEDKPALFATYDRLVPCLRMAAAMVSTMQLNKARMLAACQDGFLNATDLADYLAVKGLPFRKAHEVVGAVVRYSIEHGKRLEDLSLDELRSFCELIEQDVFSVLPIERCVARRTSIGGTSPEVTPMQLSQAMSVLRRQGDFVERERARIEKAFDVLIA